MVNQMKNLGLFKPTITFSIVTFGWVVWGTIRLAAADDLPHRGKELVYAAREGKYDAVADILRTHPGSVNAQLPQPWMGVDSQYSRWSSLHWGVERDDIALVDLLLRHGADPNLKDETNEFPLLLVKSREIATRLIEAGADVNAVGQLDHTPLNCSRSAAIAEVLVRHGAKIENHLPLHRAAERNRADVAQFLIEQGAPVNARGYDKRTPLFSACTNGNLFLAKLLIAKGADIHAKNRDGETPVWMTTGDYLRGDIFETTQVEVMRLLVKQGASLQGTNKRNETLLHQAAANGYLEVSRFLLDSGLDVNAQNEDNKTPLHWAAGVFREGRYFTSDGSREIALVELLIERGADVNAEASATLLDQWTSKDHVTPKVLTPLWMALREDDGSDLTSDLTFAQRPLTAKKSDMYANQLRNIETINQTRQKIAAILREYGAK